MSKRSNKVLKLVLQGGFAVQAVKNYFF